ncbi:MAG: DUF1565 domain-containing protein [Myxococcales bacterium]|nr:DUF1565 domain-containing protein [Myxococcales bacterium]
MRRAVVAVLGLSFVAGCQCAQLPDAVFACEPDGTCGQPGYVCGADQLCRPAVDGGSDAGFDAGPGDAGFDAGPGDAGFDAGAEDAGFDAGVEDAGFDAGVEDAGFDAGAEDAGFDAGADAGDDAGFDAGPEDAGLDAGLDAGDDAGVDGGCAAMLDEPDDNGVDDNCDGVDGDRAQAAFVDAVYGNDVFPGTLEQPFKTLARALSSGKSQVLVAEGTYVESLQFGSGRIWGGYNSDGGWARDAGAPVIAGTITLEGDGGLVRLDTLVVQAPASVIPGRASVAVTAKDVGASAVLHRCVLTGGAGADGTAGLDGDAGPSGGAGAAGLSGLEGGDGGLGAPPTDCIGGAFTLAGYTGGAGGEVGAVNGRPGEDGVYGGLGGMAVTCVTPGACLGNDGGSGLAPMSVPFAGTDGDGGLPNGSIVGLVWQALNGTAGGRGNPGLPGGGGGGGGGLLDMLMALFGRGGGGGGGGAGGCGGWPGMGGVGGGASIGLLLLDASPTVSQCTLSGGPGGRGGNGGNGGPGGAGGPGGPGGAGQQPMAGEEAGAGGDGASGGAGSTGGQGGGGAGGPSVGLWCAGTSAPALTSTSSTGSTGGAAGTPAGAPGFSASTHNCP